MAVHNKAVQSSSQQTSLDSCFHFCNPVEKGREGDENSLQIFYFFYFYHGMYKILISLDCVQTCEKQYQNRNLR